MGCKRAQDVVEVFVETPDIAETLSLSEDIDNAAEGTKLFVLSKIHMLSPRDS